MRIGISVREALIQEWYNGREALIEGFLNARTVVPMSSGS
jgi:hypothetical protein